MEADLATSPGTRRTRTVLGQVAAITLLVRLGGLVVQAVLAARVGAGTVFDAYVLALVVPQLVVVSFASAIEIAVGVRYGSLLTTDSERAALFHRSIMRWATKVSVLVGSAALLFAPVLVRASAPSGGARLHEAATTMSLVIYPSIAFQLLASAAAALQIGGGSIHRPVIAKVMNPLSMIAYLAVLQPTTVGLAVASAAGFAAETVVLLLWGRQSLRGDRDESVGDEMRATIAQLRTLGFTYSILRAVPLVDYFFVSSQGSGSLTRFSLAARMYDVVIAMLIIPWVRVVTPTIARAIDARTVSVTARRLMIRTGLIGVAASAVLALGGPIAVYTVFRNGEFGSEDARSTAWISVVLAAGLIPCAFAYLLPRLLAAMRRDRVMVSVMALQVLANALLDWWLVTWFGVIGVAMSTACVYVLVAGTEMLAWRRLLPQRDLTGSMIEP